MLLKFSCRNVNIVLKFERLYFQPATVLPVFHLQERLLFLPLPLWFNQQLPSNSFHNTTVVSFSFSFILFYHLSEEAPHQLIHQISSKMSHIPTLNVFVKLRVKVFTAIFRSNTQNCLISPHFKITEYKRNANFLEDANNWMV